jgi:F0F1-type ATP synthase membrane subunit b/b'
MKWLRTLASSSFGALAAMFLLGLPAFSAEGASQNPAESPAGSAFRWINFVVVFGGMGYLVAKHGGAFFQANARAIAAGIHQAAESKAAADRELGEAESKLAHLDGEVAALRESARQNWEIESERLRASGVVEIEKIKESARGELLAAERAAQQQLREIAASMAVSRASALLNSKMNTEVRSRLFQSFLDELDRGANCRL